MMSDIEKIIVLSGKICKEREELAPYLDRLKQLNDWESQLRNMLPGTSNDRPAKLERSPGTRAGKPDKTPRLAPGTINRNIERVMGTKTMNARGIASAMGCSQQAIFNWVHAHQDMVEKLGKGQYRLKQKQKGESAEGPEADILNALKAHPGGMSTDALVNATKIPRPILTKLLQAALQGGVIYPTHPDHYKLK